jgi:anti-sigma regulatory factor (Ser/Thr protein kinase)
MTISARADQGGSEFDREIKLEPDPAAVRKARDFVRTSLRELGCSGSADDGALIASELVTNALRAAPETPCLVAVRNAAGHPVIEVHDGSPELPERRPADVASEHGRGLHVVDALCAERTCLPSGGGKVIIVRLHKTP